MSRTFESRWKNEHLDDVLASVVLQPRLRALVEAPFERKAGGLLLKPLAGQNIGRDSFPDRTGYEAFINKVHVDDFLDDPGATERDRLGVLVRQGTKAALELSARLQNEGKYRVLLSLDNDLPTMTLRFFERRHGELWGAEDPDAFSLEEVLMIDTRS